MQLFELQFYSLSGVNFTWQVKYEDGQEQVIFDFFEILEFKIHEETRTIELLSTQKYTTELKTKLKVFVDKYKNQQPSIQRFISIFQRLELDEYFFVIPPIDLNTQKKYLLEVELMKLNGSYNEEYMAKSIELFQDILNSYEVISFDLNKSKIKIGKGRKSERICRFCQGSQPDVSFKNEAHAVSEALGNKKLILNEECDACNSFFDQQIERDFIAYHDFARTIYGIKNKENSIPKMSGANFRLYKDEEKNLTIAVLNKKVGFNERETETNELEGLTLCTNDKIRLQNIYKTLCKYALSVVDDKYLKNFEETIKWIKGEREIAHLPKVAQLHSYHFFAKQPEITVFVRNNNDRRFPYMVCEFRIALFLYIFIVPLSKEDDRMFLKEIEYDDFLNCFKHINKLDEFSFSDLSDDQARKININIKFEKILQS